MDYSDIEDLIAEALEYIDEYPDAPITHVAWLFGVPYRRLNARYHGRASRSTREPTNRKLSAVQEEVLETYLRRLDKIGLCARLRLVTSAANSILARSHDDPSTPLPTVGAHWALRWKARHPSWFTVRQRPIDLVRAAAEDVEEIQGWFLKYKAICKEHGIQPNDIWNMDETGFRIGVAKQQTVLTELPGRYTALPSSNNRESLTIIEAISAGGSAILASLILSGKMHLSTWYRHLNDDTMVGVSDTGYTNDEYAMHWIKHFDKHSSSLKTGAWRLLLMDNHGSHCTKEFIQYCDENMIQCFALPSHTTHFLQPLDVVVFQPYKHYHGEAVDIAARHGCSDYNKLEFLHDFETFRTQALKPSTLRSAFEKTSLVPYNPNKVLERLKEGNASQALPATPPPPEPNEHRTPLTIRTLKRQSNAVLQDLEDNELYQRLAPLLKGAKIQATAGAKAIDELRTTAASKEARRLRKSDKRRRLQRGGVIVAADARAAVIEREVNEAEELQRKATNAANAEYKKRVALLKKMFKPPKDRRGAVTGFKALLPQYLDVMLELTDIVKTMN